MSRERSTDEAGAGSTQARAFEIFVRAAGASSAQERCEVIDHECAGDEELREEVESLLEFHDPHSDFMESPVLAGFGSEAGLGEGFGGVVSESGDGVDLAVGVGTRLGQYTLVKVLGAGGMGVVYEAEQEMPKRRVALKIVRPGLLLGHLTRRFRFEAHALARLQHPGIAQIYDAGSAQVRGVTVPYLAMELVEGVSLGVYARREGLTRRARLELFLKIIEAVSHAHQRGVIHRDLKPANVMVTASGEPKVLDFGIARFTQSSTQAGAPGGTISPVTMVTGTGQVMGTLAYMSPEQAMGGTTPVDVRSDVYALGAMLYELLAGRPPLDVSKCSILEGVRRIADQEPSSLGTLDRSLRGDVENIVSKAIEKEASRRYQSAAALGEDVRRHLHDEPITARAASTWYQLQKFTRRNRILVAGVLGVIIALTGGLVATVHQSRLTTDALRRAQVQQENASQALEFLGGVLASGNPDVARGKELTLREALEQAAVRLERGEVKSATVAASLNGELGRAFGELGDYQRGEAMERRAQVLEAQIYGENSSAALSRIASVAKFMELQGRRDESRPMLLEAMQRAIKAHGPKAEVTFDIVMQMGNAYDAKSGGLDFAKCAWKLGEQVYGEGHARTLMAKSSYGYALTQVGKASEGLAVLLPCHEACERLMGKDHPQTIDTGVNVGVALLGVGRVSESCDWLERSLVLQRRVMGANRYKTISSTLNVASAFMHGQRFEEAYELAKDNLKECREFYAGASRDELASRGLMGAALIALKRFDEAKVVSDAQLLAAEEWEAGLKQRGGDGKKAQKVEAGAKVSDPGDPANPGDPGDAAGVGEVAVMSDGPEVGPKVGEEVLRAWTLYYDLYEAWGRPVDQALWRERIASTQRGRELLKAEAQGTLGVKVE